MLLKQENGHFPSADWNEGYYKGLGSGKENRASAVDTLGPPFHLVVTLV